MRTGDIIIVASAHTDTPLTYRIRRLPEPDLREYDGTVYVQDVHAPAPTIERGETQFRVTTREETFVCDTLPVSWDGCLIGAVCEVTQL